MMQPNKKSQQGFTLIELLVVIAIIGILSTLSIIALSNARAKSRDAKRVADIKQISTALDLYYADYGYYPTIITPGNPLVSSDGTKTYIDKIPNNPSPRNDSGCNDNNYTYSSTSNNSDYSLNFCLSSSVGSLSSGINSASSSGLGSTPGLVGWWKFDEGSGTTVYDYSGNNNNGTWSGTGANHYATGKTGSYAGNFNGSDDYINVGNQLSLNLSSELTLTAWIYKTAVNADVESIFGRWPQNNKAFMMRVEPNQNLSAQVSPGAGSNGQIFYSTLAIPLNQWVFVSMRMDSAYIYATVNGTTQSQARSIANMSESPVVNIGRIGFQTGLYYFKGYIDDARIYNRALPEGEVQAIYNAGK